VQRLPILECRRAVAQRAAEAADAAFCDKPFNSPWSFDAKVVYDGIVKGRLAYQLDAEPVGV
jgi:hypothetical protein